MKNNKISNLRVLSIILVVLAHSIIIYNPYWVGSFNINKPVPIFKYIVMFIYIFHMPLFFSISGYLFYLGKNKAISLFKFVNKKAKRLIVPYLIVGLMWYIPIRMLINYDNINDNNLLLNYLNKIILLKDMGHLWFLPTLFAIFIIAYLIEKKLPNKKCLFIILPVVGIISNLIPGIIGSIFENLVWFYFGYFINYKNIDKFKISRNLTRFFIVFVLFLSAIYLLIYGNFIYYKYVCLIIKYFIIVIIIPLLYANVSDKTNNFFKVIDDNSFGLYLFHSPMIYISYSLGIQIMPIVCLLVNFICCAFIALLITLLLRKMKLKFIIGE